MRKTITIAALAFAVAFAVAACGTPAQPTGNAPFDTAEPTIEETTATPTPKVGEAFIDDMGLKRAKLDPATVRLTECKMTRDDYTSIGEGIAYGVWSEYKAKNASTVSGTLSLTVQYSNAKGEVITEGNPGANNIRPGRTAKISDSASVERGDFPGGKVTCEVVEAKVYEVAE